MQCEGQMGGQTNHAISSDKGVPLARRTHVCSFFSLSKMLLMFGSAHLTEELAAKEVLEILELYAGVYEARSSLPLSSCEPC